MVDRETLYPFMGIKGYRNAISFYGYFFVSKTKNIHFEKRMKIFCFKAFLINNIFREDKIEKYHLYL